MPNRFLLCLLLISLGGLSLQAKWSSELVYSKQPFAKTALGSIRKTIGRMVDMTTADGVPAKAYYIPSKKLSNKYVIVFHEWWGLTDEVKTEVEHLYHQLKNTHVIAVDLYDGKKATTKEEASQLVIETDEKRITNIIQAAFSYAGKDAIVATYGWGLGGSYSLKTAMQYAGNVSACVLFYGMPELEVTQLKQLKCPVLGIFGKYDQYIDTSLVKQFETGMQKANKTLLTRYYEVGYAFINPTSPTYNKKAAGEAFHQAIRFIRKHLKANITSSHELE